MNDLVKDTYFKVCLAGNDTHEEQDISDFISELSHFLLNVTVNPGDESVSKIIHVYTCLMHSGFIQNYLLIPDNTPYSFGTEMALRLKRIGNPMARDTLIQKYKTRIIAIQFLRSFGIYDDDFGEILDRMIGLTTQLQISFGSGVFAPYAKTMEEKWNQVIKLQRNE